MELGYDLFGSDLLRDIPPEVSAVRRGEGRAWAAVSVMSGGERRE